MLDHCWRRNGVGESIADTALREINEDTGLCGVTLGPVVWYGEDSTRSGARGITFKKHLAVAHAPSENVRSDRWTEHEHRQILEVLNAGLSLLAELIALTLAIPPRQGGTERGRFFTESLVGIAKFRRSRRLLVALVFSAFAYFSFFLYDTLIALLADGFGFGPTAIGLAIAASALGGLIGALVAGRFAAKRPIATIAVAAMISGLTTATVAATAMAMAKAGWPLHLAMFLLVLALMGGATAFMLVPYRTIVQVETPPDRIGRVFAAGAAVITITMLSAPLIGSTIAARWGTPAAFLVGGCPLAVWVPLPLATRARSEAAVARLASLKPE